MKRNTFSEKDVKLITLKEFAAMIGMDVSNFNDDMSVKPTKKKRTKKK